MLPSGWRRPPGCVLALEGEEAVLRRRRAGQWVEDGRLPAAGRLAGRLRARLRACRRILLLVPPAWVLRRVLRLPEAAAARLEDVLAFELEAQLPLRLEEVLWQARILRRLPDLGRIEVEVAVLPRHLVAPIAARLREAGVAAPILACTAPGEWPALALDPLAPVPRDWRALAAPAFAALATMLALHLGLAAHRDALARAAALEARAAAARQRAAATEALEREVVALRRWLDEAAALRGRPPAVAVLEEAARRLPDGAWLTELRLDGDALRLTGHAAAPDALIAQLGAAPIFREVRFAAPVLRGAEGADRVQLALRVAAPPPAAAPLRTVAR
jgi:general secretion pathway protein L